MLLMDPGFTLDLALAAPTHDIPANLVNGIEITLESTDSFLNAIAALAHKSAGCDVSEMPYCLLGACKTPSAKAATGRTRQRLILA